MKQEWKPKGKQRARNKTKKKKRNKKMKRDTAMAFNEPTKEDKHEKFMIKLYLR